MIENDGSEKDRSQPQGFFEKERPLGVGTVVVPTIYRDAFAASKDRVTIYQNTVDMIGRYSGRRPGHILHQDIGISGNMFPQILRYKTSPIVLRPSG